MFVLSTFICFAMICACQKQDSAAEAQLAQRKAELDAREKALDEREKALGEREKAITKSPGHSLRFSVAQDRLSIPSRRKLKEKGEYNSFLPNFRRSFVTAHCWMLEQLKKAREQKTEPQNYSVVSKRHEERR